MLISRYRTEKPSLDTLLARCFPMIKADRLYSTTRIRWWIERSSPHHGRAWFPPFYCYATLGPANPATPATPCSTTQSAASYLTKDPHLVGGEVLNENTVISITYSDFKKLKRGGGGGKGLKDAVNIIVCRTRSNLRSRAG